jgi:hypothetical protein
VSELEPNEGIDPEDADVPESDIDQDGTPDEEESDAVVPPEEASS